MAASTAIPDQPRTPRRSRGVGFRCRIAAGVLLLSGLGCGRDTAAPPLRAPGQLYWALRLNEHAVMLALPPSPYDTVQLTATPVNAAGAPLATTGTVIFKALDTTVTVSPTGLVTAHALTPVDRPVRVAATLQDPVQRVTHTDTVRIVVTATVPPAIDTFSLQPVAGDSAKRALLSSSLGSSFFAWPVRAFDVNGTEVCGVQQCAIPVYYQSSKPDIASIDPITGTVRGLDTGHVVFTAQTLAYGQVLRDSVHFQLGYMVNYGIDLAVLAGLAGLIVVFGAPKRLILGLGAVITFCNTGYDPNTGTFSKETRPVDIVFDHPEAVDTASCVDAADGIVGPPTGSGNIPAFGGDTLDFSVDFACRRFNVPGLYRYHSTLFPSDTYEIEIKQDPR